MFSGSNDHQVTGTVERSENAQRRNLETERKNMERMWKELHDLAKSKRAIISGVTACAPLGDKEHSSNGRTLLRTRRKKLNEEKEKEETEAEQKEKEEEKDIKSPVLIISYQMAF